MLTDRDHSTKVLLLLGAVSFLPTLFFYLVGEEGIYTITSMEMWHQNNWAQQIMYGADNQRPPLVNWLIMPLANLIGWTHVVIAARLVSVTATLGMIGWLYWLSFKLFADKSFALFAALAGLSLADLLLYRGWLTYTDPVFSFFTFGAMATLWVAAIERSRPWLLLSVLLVSCAMLSKAFTAYIFYGTVVLVLLWQGHARKFLLSPLTLLAFLVALMVPLVWFAMLPQVGGHGTSMAGEILRKLTAINAPGYLSQLLTFPFDTALRLSPAVLLAAYLLLRRRVTQVEIMPVNFQAACLITALCFLPYWLSPHSSIRYLLPIYLCIALVSARLIWRAGGAARILALRWFAGIVAFKFIFSLLLMPYYQNSYRGENYAHTALEIMRRTEGFPLYVTDARSIGLSIVGYMDIKRWPQTPLVRPPVNWENGFVLAADKTSGRVAETYRVAGDEIFLLCRGAACMAGVTRSAPE